MRTLPFCLAASCALNAFAWQPGRNTLILRGQPQEIQFLPASGAVRGRILYLPGDGGWRGFAVDIAKAMAAWGYDVVGVNTHRYLTSFTNQRTLTEAEMRADLVEFARRAGEGRPVRFVGWSQGAAMAALAGAAPEARTLFSGIAAIGIPVRAVLGWRLADNLTWLTRRLPDEPFFEVQPCLQRLASLPFALVQSRGDEFTSPAEAERLFSAAAAPKKLLWVAAADHKFADARPAFYQSLRTALEWLDQVRRTV